GPFNTIALGVSAAGPRFCNSTFTAVDCLPISCAGKTAAAGTNLSVAVEACASTPRPSNVHNWARVWVVSRGPSAPGVGLAPNGATWMVAIHAGVAASVNPVVQLVLT